MANRSNLRDNIRKILKQHFTKDTLAATINATVTEIQINIPDLYSVGDILGLASDDATAEELVQVVGKPATTSDTGDKLTISRSMAGSTAKTHASGNVVRVYPEFSEADLNLAINYGINDTFVKHTEGGHGIWIEVQDTTLTTSIAREYTVPSGITFLTQIEIADANNNYQVSRRWRISGAKIVFHGAFPATGKTIRVNGVGYQAQLTDDATSLTINDEALEFVEFTAAWRLLEWRLPERLRATIYSAAVNERAGQPIEIMNMI